MTDYVLSFKPAIWFYGNHDPSAALFREGNLIFGTEEERYTREKHAEHTFPTQAIEACLDYEDIELTDVSKIILPYDPSLGAQPYQDIACRGIREDAPLSVRAWRTLRRVKNNFEKTRYPTKKIEDRLEQLGSPVPPIETRSHHRCHAASAYYPTSYNRAVVVTADGKGEYDSTVVWHASGDSLRRIRTYEVPNSLGYFFGAVTEYLGYRANNGEGKVMGLAPYGEYDKTIENALRSVATFGREYDVTGITDDGLYAGVEVLEDLFDQPRNPDTRNFDSFHENVAHTTQRLLEETVTEIVDYHVRDLGISDVCFSGGVALNCKLNKRIRELEPVDDLFVQPVAHDGGLALGAGWLESDPDDVERMSTVYWGPDIDPEKIHPLLESSKVSYEKVDQVEQYVADRLADGDLVGWVQGRQEMGPRALGNRSILADPRTIRSRNRVNKHVKHREEWRPFAPSLLEERADEYLVDSVSAPYMIQTFDTSGKSGDDIDAVVHPADRTTRPQTVRRDQNPRYYDLIAEFESITGVPVVLNTSFNDHGEPIVTTAREALSDFYTMGLDVLAIEDYVVKK